MRGELALPATRSDSIVETDRAPWAVIGFCFIGLALTMYFAVSAVSADQIPLLIMQANLW